MEMQLLYHAYSVKRTHCGCTAQLKEVWLHFPSLDLGCQWVLWAHRHTTIAPAGTSLCVTRSMTSLAGQYTAPAYTDPEPKGWASLLFALLLPPPHYYIFQQGKKGVSGWWSSSGLQSYMKVGPFVPSIFLLLIHGGERGRVNSSGAHPLSSGAACRKELWADPALASSWAHRAHGIWEFLTRCCADMLVTSEPKGYMTSLLCPLCIHHQFSQVHSLQRSLLIDYIDPFLEAEG